MLTASPYRTLAAGLDPARLARQAGIDPDPWQAQALRSPAPRLLFNCARQSGKSTVAALLGLHRALYRPASLVLLLSASQRQSAELYRTLARFYAATGATIPPTAESALRLELANRSRVISLPASEATVRGYASVDLLVVDEAARVSSELYYSILPTLAVSGGRLIALSTPFGTRGWWYDAWRSADAWDRYEVPATRCPRIPAGFLEEQRRVMGEWWFNQEFLCHFMDAESQAFGAADIDRAFMSGVETWPL